MENAIGKSNVSFLSELINVRRAWMDQILISVNILVVLTVTKIFVVSIAENTTNLKKDNK